MKLWATLLLLGCAAMPVSASAEDENASRLREFGQCIVKRDRPTAEELMMSVPGSAESARIEARLLKRFDLCLVLPGSASIPSRLMRGAVAQALYEKRYGSRKPPVLTAQGYRIGWLADSSVLSPEDFAIYAFATCVSSAMPESSHWLSVSQLNSPDETKSIAALTAQFSQCLPQGSKMTLNRQTVRGAIAEALYQQATAPAGVKR